MAVARTNCGATQPIARKRVLPLFARTPRRSACYASHYCVMLYTHISEAVTYSSRKTLLYPPKPPTTSKPLGLYASRQRIARHREPPPRFARNTSTFWAKGVERGSRKAIDFVSATDQSKNRTATMLQRAPRACGWIETSLPGLVPLFYLCLVHEISRLVVPVGYQLIGPEIRRSPTRPDKSEYSHSGS